MVDASEDRDVLLNQLAEEFAARQRAGERPRLNDYCERHPDLAEDIRALFPALVELERAKDDAGSELAVAASPPITNLGDFRLLREVGRGGMGVVYEAEQISLGRRVALKLLPATVFRDPVKRRRFEREAKAAAKLHHTNIVPVHGFGDHDSTPYYVMQFISGLGLDAVISELRRLPAEGRSAGSQRPAPDYQRSLSVALARSLVGADEDGTATCHLNIDNARTLNFADGPTPDITSLPPLPILSSHAGEGGLGASVSLSASSAHLPGHSASGSGSVDKKKPTYCESVARIGIQVGGALAYAHKQGVLHRDIKPANLLLDMDGVVWVTDFGLAKADDSDNLTNTGDILGTLRYMPPEAFEGKSDARGDIYSLGLTLYELLALRPAFDDKDRNKLVKQMTTSEPVGLDKVRKEIPRDLVTIVQKAIAKEPAGRYATAEAMAADLQRFIDDEPILARRQSQFERYVRWARHNPGIAVLGGVLTAVLVLATIASLIVANRMSNLAVRESQAAVDQGIARHAAVEAQKRADSAAEVAQRNLYYAQMHLGQQTWREHRGLPHMRELLANWLPNGDAPDRRGWEWYYLSSLPYQNLSTLTEGVASDKKYRPCIVAWHAASKRLAAGHNDGLIRIWDVEREQATLTLNGPVPTHVWCGTTWFAWRPNGEQLATGGNDGSLHVWETSSGLKRRVLQDHTSPIRSVAYSSDGQRVAAWAQDGVIKIWDADTGRLLDNVTHPRGISAGAWSPDDQFLACGHEDGTVTISGARAGDKIVTLRGHVDEVFRVAWSPDGTRLISTSGDFTAKIWDVAAEKMVVGPLRHSHGITSVAWEPGGHRLATGSADETVKVWNAATGSEELTLRGQVDAVTSLAWSPDGRLAAGADDSSVRIWTAIREQESRVLPGRDVRTTSVSWSPDGKRLASGDDDGNIRIWDPVTGAETRAIHGHDERGLNPQFGLIRTLAWSPDGTLVASGGLDGAAKVWEVASGREIFALPVDCGLVWSVAWSPVGTQLAIGSQDGSIRLVEGLPQTRRAAARSPDRAAVGSGDPTAAQETPKVRVFKANEPARLGTAGSNGVRTLAWSPQGDRLASAGPDRLIKIWDPIHGTELARMPGHQGWILSIAWSPDGKQLASSGADRHVIAWNVETGQKLSTMRGHNDFVDSVVWSPNGKQLATAGLDNSVRIWDPRTGEETFVLRGKFGMFHQVSWHPDAAQLAAASSDGHIWIWDATHGFKRNPTARSNMKKADDD